MHRLSSKRAVRALRISALSLVVSMIGLISVLLALVFAYITNDWEALVRALQAGAVPLFAYLLYKIFSSGVRCPLCHGGLVSKNLCSKNRQAKRLLGSYRLRVSLGVLSLNRFRCPCCGELVEVRARDRNNSQHTRR